MTITGFNIPSQTCAEDLEYRLTLSILPLRCYLDGRYIQFLKVFASQFGNLHPPTTTTQVVATGEDLPTGLPPALTDSLDNKFDEKDMTLSPPPSIYFQSWRVNVIDLKIDYTPDQVIFAFFNSSHSPSWISKLCNWAIILRLSSVVFL